MEAARLSQLRLHPLVTTAYPLVIHIYPKFDSIDIIHAEKENYRRMQL